MPTTAHGPVHSTWSATLRTALAATAAVCVVLLAFVWPTRTSTVKDLPLDVVGLSQPAGAQARAALTRSGTFALRDTPSREAALVDIAERHAYGAVVLPAAQGQPIEVVTAPAASPAVAQMLAQVGAGIQAQAAQQVASARADILTKAAKGGASAAQAQAALAQVPTPTVKVTDAAPLTEHDPRGAGLAISALPIAMGGMIGGVLISLLVTGSRRRLAATALYAFAGGMALAAILGPWLGLLPGAWWHIALVMTAALGSTAATIVGLHALLGQPGIGVGAVITMFLGNPLSSASAPKEFMPWHWGEIGQWFVPGAATNLLRLVSYFPQASRTQDWLALGLWGTIGLVAMLAGRFRDQEVIHIDGATEPDAPGAGPSERRAVADDDQPVGRHAGPLVD